jgi:hypothetical protein
MAVPRTVAALAALLPVLCCASDKGAPSSRRATERPPARGDTISHGGHDPQIRPAAARPFDEISDYIASLDRADHSVWQRPDVVVDAPELVGDEAVVDLGAGSGYFSFRLARELPWGSVLALDPEAEMVAHVNDRAASEPAPNVSVRLVHPASPVRCPQAPPSSLSSSASA